jgi:anaerobic selenocysteine-containing dehydrogenase
VAFVPHYEPPRRHGSREQYPFDFIDYKSRLNREGRSANLPWYHEFKKMDPGDVSWDDVLKMNPADATRLGLKEGDMVKVSSMNGSITVKLHLWQGIRPGTVTKAYGQGHWAYGRVASKEFGKTPRGANNNELLVDDYDRLSGATARNGGFTGVQIVKA